MSDLSDTGNVPFGHALTLLEKRDFLIDEYRDKPVWGVVSSYAADSFYRDMTYEEAEDIVERETKEPGRDAVIVLVISTKAGPKL